MTSPADPPGQATVAAGHHPVDHPGQGGCRSKCTGFRDSLPAGRAYGGRTPEFSGNNDTPCGTPRPAVYTEGDEPEWRSPAHGSKTGPALWSSSGGLTKPRYGTGDTRTHPASTKAGTVTRLRHAVGSILAARRAALRPGAPSPFVTQSQLIDLVKTDRADIQRHLHHAEQMMRHPYRGTAAAPYLLTADWRRFLRWLDAALQHLQQPRPAADLEHLIRTWQHRRTNIEAPTLNWHRRADVIAV